MNSCINIHTDMNFALSELERNKEILLREISNYISPTVKLNLILEDDLSKFINCMDYLNIKEEREEFKEDKPITKIQFMDIDTSKSNEIEKYLIEELGAKRIS